MILVKYTDLGVKDYKETWDYQRDIHVKLTEMKTGKSTDKIRQQLIFVEHPHVYTLGKSGKENNLLVNPEYLKSLGATFYRIDRGGDITYHGPGQLVGYPILDLDALGMGVKQYILALEQTIIDALRDYDMMAGTMEGATGVWLEGDIPDRSRKICAIGVRVSRGVTMHGFALNVNTDLNYFNHINPCGFSDRVVTSMEKELGCKTDMQEVKEKLLLEFQQHFGIRFI